MKYFAGSDRISRKRPSIFDLFVILNIANLVNLPEFELYNIRKSNAHTRVFDVMYIFACCENGNVRSKKPKG